MQAGKQMLCSIGFVAVAVMMNMSILSAQSAIDEVHVQPRAQSGKPEVPGALAQGATAIIRKSVELVLVPVTVMDESNRIITGLTRENFQLYEGKQAQPIKHLWKEDTPVSAGISLAISGRSDTKLERARDPVAALLTAPNPPSEL